MIDIHMRDDNALYVVVRIPASGDGRKDLVCVAGHARIDEGHAICPFKQIAVDITANFVYLPKAGKNFFHR